MCDQIRLPILTILLVISFAHVAAQEPADTNYDESKVPKYRLPELFTSTDGSTIETSKQWIDQRRPEVLHLFEENIYGHTPTEKLRLIRSVVREEADEALHGTAIRQQVRIYLTGNETPRIDVLIYFPKHCKEPVPAFLGLNFYGNQTVHADERIEISNQWMRGNSRIGIRNGKATEATRGVYQDRWQPELLINRGYALVTAYCGDIDPDNYRHDFSDGVHPLFYEDGQTTPKDNEWGTIGAWAWGLSRILDHLQNEPKIDSSRVAVIGHSRLGKTALWAGAQDQRFALVVSNNSGCGGAALYRRCFGERIHHMIKPVGYWFCRKHREFAHKEHQLPVDQHMLIALVAPRPVYVASAEKDKWADPKGEFLAAKNASSIYRLFGKSAIAATEEWPELNQPIHTTIGYHIRSGDHNVTKFDWLQYLKFADRHFGD